MSTETYLSLGAVLFGVGTVGTLIRSTASGRLIGVELMLAAAALTFVAAAMGFRELEGQVAALVVAVVAGAQAIVGYSIVAAQARAE